MNAKSYLDELSGRRFYSLPLLEKEGYPLGNLPYSIRILLENILRHSGEGNSAEAIEALAGWTPGKAGTLEIPFRPARVILQDFTGVPAIVDLAAMRETLSEWKKDPWLINPVIPVDLVIDHSIQVDVFGNHDAPRQNAEIEFLRNHERYSLLSWARRAFENLRVVPPDTGIIHQINLEYLARSVFDHDGLLYPDTLVGTDSHTTMINALGVLGWGVGGIEAEAAILGLPVPILVPDVVGVRLSGRLNEGITATDLVLTVTERLREVGVVGRFVEFFGPGLPSLTVAERAVLSNMSPEYGSTCAIFPFDERTIDYLRMTGRSDETVRLIEEYMRAQKLFGGTGDETLYSERVEIDLSKVVPSLAGPKRPQDRIPLGGMKARFAEALNEARVNGLIRGPDEAPQDLAWEGGKTHPGDIGRPGEPVTVPDGGGLGHGSVVIAAITSCTNTSNPALMIGAGLLARNAVKAGLTVKPWVKTSLAPGSRVVTNYLEASGLLRYLEALSFHLVGYGCTTCIGNSGPLPEDVAFEIRKRNLFVAGVLSGNRNFEGRIHPLVRANYLASPPLVVAFAIAGRVDIDLENEPISDGLYLRDIWPSQGEIMDTVGKYLSPESFISSYDDLFEGDDLWQSLDGKGNSAYDWPDSRYIKRPEFLEHVPTASPDPGDIEEARALLVLGDSVTTDHISPAGTIQEDSPAGVYLKACGVAPKDFNSYGSRRGNHEVMVRGTFANVRIRNLLAPGTEGGFTRILPEGKVTTVHDAAVQYDQRKVPLIVIAGKEYGTGSSRDWAAKGTAMLGIKAVIAESFERIHRSNLIGMGVLPLEFLYGENRETLGLEGDETFEIKGIGGGDEPMRPNGRLLVTARNEDGSTTTFEVKSRIDTETELEYFQAGGILPYALRSLAER